MSSDDREHSRLLSNSAQQQRGEARSRSAQDYQLPRSQFMFWIAASFCYMMGGFCFLPQSEYYATGAVWFGIGSISLLTSDCMDWWLTQHGHHSSSSSSNRYNEVATPLLGRLWENQGLQLNILLSILSTIILFIGAMLLIEASTLTIGLWLFIFGILTSMISQIWKAFRCRLTLKTLWREAGNAVFTIDVAVLIFNVGILIGDTSFLVASIFTLLAFSDSVSLSDDYCLTTAGSCFILAGSFYLLSVSILWCLLVHHD